jgi:hypothetical protein
VSGSFRHMRCSLFLLTPLLLATGCGATSTVTVTKTETRPVTITETVRKVTPSGPAVYVPESAGRLLYKPSVIVTGASGGQILFDRWISYGEDPAKAKARFLFNDCTPNCAAGKQSVVRTMVALRSIVLCRGAPVYESLEVLTSQDETQLPRGEPMDLLTLCHEGQGPP